MLAKGAGSVRMDRQTGLELEPLPGCAGEAQAAASHRVKSTIEIPDYGDAGFGDEDEEGGVLTEVEMADAQFVAAAIDKPSDPKRWIVLVLATLAIFGPYYVFDNPAGTQQTVRKVGPTKLVSCCHCRNWPTPLEIFCLFCAHHAVKGTFSGAAVFERVKHGCTEQHRGAVQPGLQPAVHAVQLAKHGECLESVVKMQSHKSTES